MNHVAIFIATAGYLGYFPVAPGTIGSAAGLGVYALVSYTGSSLAEAAAIVLLCLLGIWSGGIAERHFGRIDPGPVVIDEVVGMLITLVLIPVGWPGALAGFFLFRLFDIIKPYPAGRLERLAGGLGIMADDVMAAIYANLALRAVLRLSSL